jgi:hypothetical protein
MKLHRFKAYETVYLFNTDYKDYAFTSSDDGKYGTLKTTLWDDRKAEFLVQSSGLEEESIFRFHPTYGDPLDEDEFLKAVKDFLYVFNKNRLKYKATLVSSKFDQHLSPYALFRVEPKVTVSDLERILATTKITNAKVKADVPIDKLVYQTAKVDGKEYEWSKIKQDIKKFLDSWAKHDNTDLHAVANGELNTAEWSDSQYKKGRGGEAMRDFYTLIEQIRQFRNRYK